MGKSSSIWALLLLFSCVLAGPIQQNTCSSECRSPAVKSKFRYAAGQTYTYNFQANTMTWMMGTSDDKALLGVKGQALVTFRAPCDAVLQLREINISGHLDEKVDASELQKRPLSFSWQDGTVDSLCPEQDEPVWVVNIKRSVLSMLQHTAQFVDVNQSHVIESDVIGRCPTEYAVESTGKGIKVIKTKIPNQCSHRIDHQSSIPTVAYHVPAETQTIPLMNSTSVCEQQIKDNVIKSVECRETHLFRPLSTKQGGARTEVTSSISLISTTKATTIELSSNREPKSLFLDSRGVLLDFQDVKDVNTVVRLICKHLAGDSPARVSQLFTELVHSLRKASPKEVRTAWNNLRGKKICSEAAKTEKLFLDALPQAGSSGTIALMVDILKENKLSSRQALGWYLSLPLSEFANLEAVKAVLPLVDGASNSPVALLGLTGLARRYCVKNMEECQSSADVLQFSTKLSKMLGNKCHVDAKNEVKVISVLKALGNLGVMTPEVRSTVSECAKDASLPATIRLAAIEATRNTPCNQQVKGNLLHILEDSKEDAEIRIAAYQGVMRCPCSSSIVRIQQVLNSEETNQVGSYISGHLKNIKLNPTPGKENARNLVKKLNLEKSFPQDFRKYSLNMAVSDFCPINNAGWDIDSNIVYSPKSFIPRSASMNLTLDLFGQSVNLFEFGVRSENLERVVMPYLDAYLGSFGPSILKKTSDSVSHYGENVWNLLTNVTRSKRADIKTNELTHFDKLVNMKEKPADIKLDAYLRVFGSEIGMVNYRGSSSGLPRLELMDDLQSRIADAWDDLIKGAKRVNVDVARSMMFMDSSVTFPTIAGFPLRLAVNGTSTVGLGLESQLDLPALLRDPLNANIKLKVNPLAVTEVSASMTVDIAVAKTGIKMAATIHSSMAADFNAQLQQGKTVEVKLDLPKSKMTLIDFKSSVLLIQQSVGKTERNKPVRIANETIYSRGGCSERLSFMTGMRLCATSSVSIPRPAHDPFTFSTYDTVDNYFTDPTPAFPLGGSTAFAIVLEKTEPLMKGYLLSMTTTQESPRATYFLMQVNTPGSTTNRKISIKGTLTSAPTLSIKVDTQAPWGNLAAEAELVNSADVKSAMVKIITQDKREFYSKAQVKVTQGNRKYSLATTLETGWPSQPRAIILEGGLSDEFDHPNWSVKISLKPSGPFANLPYGFQVTLGHEFSATVQKVWLTNFQLLTPLGSILLSTEIGRQDRNYVAAFNMKYGSHEQNMHGVSFNGQVQSQSLPTERTVSYKTTVVYKSTRFPDMNIDMKLDVQDSPTTLSNVLILVHGPEMEHSTNRLYINRFSQLKGSVATKDFAYENKFEITYPRYALNVKVDQALKIDDRLIKGIANLHLDNIKLFDTDLALVIAPKDPKNFYELSFKMACPGLTITLVDTGKRIDRNSFSMSPVLEFQPGGKIEMMGKASLINDENGLSVDMKSEIRISELIDPIKVHHTLLYQYEYQDENTGEMTMTTTNKIEWGGQPLLMLDAKISFPSYNLPAVELAFMLNELVDAKMAARLTSEESKLELDLNLIGLQRRVQVNSQHNFVGVSQSASFNVALDTNTLFGFDGTLNLPVIFSDPLRFKLTVNTPIPMYETNELSFEFHWIEDRGWEVDVIIGLSGIEAKLNGRLDQHEIDLNFNLPSIGPIRSVTRIGTHGDIYSVDTRLVSAIGTLTVEGSAQFNDGFEVNVKVDFPELDINDIKLKVLFKHEEIKLLELTIMRESATLVVFKHTYTSETNYRPYTKIQGKYTFSLSIMEIGGISAKFLHEHHVIHDFEYDYEYSYSHKTEIELDFSKLTQQSNGYVTLSNYVKRTNKEKQASFSLSTSLDHFDLTRLAGKMRWNEKEKSTSITGCTPNGVCYEDSVAFLNTGVKPEINEEFNILSKSMRVGDFEETKGLRIRHIYSKLYSKFEQSIQLIDEYKDGLSDNPITKSATGYKVYKKDNEYGLEFYTPKRTAATTFEIASANSPSGKTQFILTDWLDKTNAPERKLVIVTSVEPHMMGDMEGLITSTTIRHPMLPKDLEYKLEYHVGRNDRDIFHFKLDADVMDPKHQRWSLETRVRNLLTDNNARSITVDMELRSKGADVSALLSLYGGYSADYLYSTGANLKLKEKERIEKELFAQFDVGTQNVSLSFGSPAKKMSFESRWYIINNERFQLSASTRLFGLSPTVYILNMNTSPHIDIRVFSVLKPSENYHLTVGGLVDETHFELALIRQLNVQKKELAAVYVALNSTDHLSTRLTWKLDDLREFLASVQVHFEDAFWEILTNSNSLVDELGAVVYNWHAFTSLKSMFEEFVADYSKELDKIDLEVLEGIKNLSGVFDTTSYALFYLFENFKFYMEPIFEIWSVFLENLIRYTIENGFDTMCEEVSMYVNEFLSIFFYAFDSIQNAVVWIEGLLIDGINILAELKQFFQRVNINFVVEIIVTILDDAIFSPLYYFLIDFAEDYPETIHFIYYYGKPPIYKIRYYIWTTVEATRTSPSNKKSYSPLIGELLINDLENGEIHYLLPLMSKFSSLRDLLIFGYSQLVHLSRFPSHSLRDVGRVLSAKYDPRFAFTRINGYASLIGSKGLITFDKKSFDLSGSSCQYLLARDFLNKDFAISVNFDGSSKNCIKKSVVFTDGTDRVEINDNYQVLINNSYTDTNFLPVFLKTFSVELFGWKGVLIKRSSDVVLTWDLSSDVLSLELSPLYAGRTLGLWGTFNSEDDGDMIKPNGKPSKDLNSFINSWKINKSCQDNIKSVTSSQSSRSYDKYDFCSNFALYPRKGLCPMIVSPAPYYELCVKFASIVNNERDFFKLYDNLLSGYKRSCARWDVNVYNYDGIGVSYENKKC